MSSREISLDSYVKIASFGFIIGKVSIPLDWNTQTSANGEIFWKASQGKGKADLVVELVKEGEDLWNVNVFTDNQGNRRKKIIILY